MSAAGCRSTQDALDNDDSQMADPFGEAVADDRETVLIEPADLHPDAFEIAPAVFDTVMIRVNEGDGGSTAIVEVLLKGSFPDGCSSLHELDQKPTAAGQTITLSMRRPATAICTQVVRPYRFFFTLDRRFGPGKHVLEVNGRSFPFEVNEL